MRVRLDKYLANMGVGSRKEVKEYIRKGLVAVNGQVETLAKRIVDTDDEISLNNEIIGYQAYVYFMLNKPKGVITATRDRRDTVLDLLDEEDRKRDVFPVGRLDMDTTGLLLITDDGRLAHELLSPKKKVPKTYLALVDKSLDEKDIQAFQKGFYLEPEKVLTQAADLEILEEKLARVTIVEGKYHQVKRMFAFCGKEVIELRRISMGKLMLDESLKEGEYRPLDEEEINLFKEVGEGTEEFSTDVSDT